MQPTGDRPDPPPSDRIRHWPPHRPPDANDSVLTACPACALRWQVHRSMAGFRLRCECGAWVPVPLDEAARRALLPSSDPATDATGAVIEATPRRRPLERQRSSTDEQGRIVLRLAPGETHARQIPTSMPMAPGSLQQANAATRATWTSRAIVEFVLLLGAILGPQLAILLLTRGEEEVLLMPFASLLSGALILVLAAVCGPYGTTGLRGSSPRYFGEAIAAAGSALGIAWLWIHLLVTFFPGLAADPLRPIVERLGPAGAVFVVAVTPAVVEEIAFRGLLQGRLLALLGSRMGWMLTAGVFALCHGATLGLPLQFGLGLYLGWLRERAGSLLPGMLTHFAYNAAIVLWMHD